MSMHASILSHSPNHILIPHPQKHTKSSNGALDPNRRGGTLLWFQGTRETWGILKYQELEIGISRVRDTKAILQQRVSERTGALMSPAYDHTVGPILVAGRRPGLGERIHSH